MTVLDRFLPVATRKLNELIRREDFEYIEDVSSHEFSVTIKFKDKRCKVNDFGKVKWFN